MVKGQIMTEQSIAELDKDDWPTRTFTPTADQAAAAPGLALAGFAVTTAIARFGRERKPAPRMS